MWVIASLPFWLLATTILIVGIACICLAFDDEFTKARKIYEHRGGYFIFGIICLPIAGVVAMLAAKIAS